MKRIRKVHTVRRDELLDAAWALFTEKGFDTVSVREVVDRVGVAKGTFYHYFSSKDDLLEAVLERVTEENLPSLEKLMKAPELGALDKLNRLLAITARWRIDNAAFVRNVLARMFSDENLRLRHHMYRKNGELAGPILAHILEQGAREGVLDVTDFEGTAEMILQLGFQMGELNAGELTKENDPDETIGRMTTRYERYCRGLERLAGAPRQSIHLPGKQVIAAIVRAGDT